MNSKIDKKNKKEKIKESKKYYKKSQIKISSNLETKKS